ncbi:MAG: electron transfer flavoprotein beta subunit [Verrucomicrobiales bacterium]|jgi:electron transfer flavoprotein beta subunit
MRILALVKRVPAPGARINITEDEQYVDDKNLGHAISPHEECGVEAAVQLIEKHGGETTVLSMGADVSEEQLRASVSVGVDKMVLVSTDGVAKDPQETAAALTAAINELEAADGAFDLIIFGNESADSGGFQVGVRIAHTLGRPMVNGIKGLELPEGQEPDAADGHIIARREVDSGFEVYELPLPACVGVKEGINLPRYPTMRGRLASKKAELATVAATAEAGGQGMVRLVSPPEVASETVILGTGPDAAPAVVDLLEELGVL